MTTAAQLERLYDEHVAAKTAMSAHLPRLRALAQGLDLAVEFGVKRGGSSTALLLGAARVLSFDLVATAEARALRRLVGDRWTYRIEDSRAAQVPECDLLLVDSLHTYAQVRDELAAHGHKARRYLVFHDVTTFGEVGADGETGCQQWTYVRGQSVPAEYLGIRPAIDEYMARDDTWKIRARYADSHGLLVLERR